MQQLILKCLTPFALAYLAITNTFALPFFGSPNAVSNNGTPSRVMSGEEFSNRVNTLNQQTQSHLSEQTNTVLPKQPSASLDSSTVPAAAPLTPPSPPTANIMPPPAGTNTTTFPSSNNNTLKTPPAPSSAPVQQQNQSTYSGFGTGDTKRPVTNSSSSNSGGGWNIKY